MLATVARLWVQIEVTEAAKEDEMALSKLSDVTSRH